MSLFYSVHPFLLPFAGLIDGDDAILELDAARLIGQFDLARHGGRDVGPGPLGPLPPHDAIGAGLA